MSAQTGLADLLRSGTAEHHHRAERGPFQRRMVRGEISRAEYGWWLGQMLLLHEGLEAALPRMEAELPPSAALARWGGGKAQLARADLRVQGLDPTGLHPLEATAAFLARVASLAEERPSALVGPLYVLEGSTNGNRHIARRLREALGGGVGFSYLDPYGDAQPERWARFRAALQELLLPSGTVEAVIEAAQETFEAVAMLGGAAPPPSPPADPPGPLVAV